VTDDCFGAAAARLCSAANMLLGWRPDEFWDATPAELVLAFQAPPGECAPPDSEVVEELRRRFPDE